ncbi:hypothetical protein Pmani_024656 [Petrolisthes manimaculis]|uniref:SURF1-like protein n=1 Tax=Petrolisthes manimaculis TaxID=1843537 RepID=A0AAE1P7Q1_9EUCA|nr:hypothetical protein Pmani_024656 [Petrolisthes manimaculis]
MSVLVRQGCGLGQCWGRYTVVHKISSSLLQTRNCAKKIQLGYTRGNLGPVRRLTTRAAVDTWNPMSIVLLIIPAGTFCLGTWQFQRRKWKLNLIEELEAKTTAIPIDFPEDVSELEDLEYQRVKLTGTFDHSQEIFLGPRPLLVGGDVKQAGSSLISSGQSGYLVVTPFKLADRDLTVLINRGWVSRRQKKPETRLDGQVTGVVELTGVFRRGEQRAPFMPKTAEGSILFTYRDVDKMAEQVGATPVFLDAVESQPGGPQGSQTRATLRNEHFSYMMTWYGLSLATTYLWYRRFIMGKSLM